MGWFRAHRIAAIDAQMGLPHGLLGGAWGTALAAPAALRCPRFRLRCPRCLSASAPAALNAGNATGPPGDGSRALGAHPYEVVGQRVPVCSGERRAWSGGLRWRGWGRHRAPTFGIYSVQDPEYNPKIDWPSRLRRTAAHLPSNSGSTAPPPRCPRLLTTPPWSGSAPATSRSRALEHRSRRCCAWRWQGRHPAAGRHARSGGRTTWARRCGRALPRKR